MSHGRARRRGLGPRSPCLATLLLLAALASADPPPQPSAEGEKPFPNSVFLEVEGVRIHFRVWSPETPASTPRRAMLVHGYGGSTFDWRFQGETLARAGVETWALDLPPFGWSALEDPFPKGAAARARLLAACLDAVDLSRGRETGGAWILVGHSLGSRVVSYFAIEHPARVDRLVLVSPAMTTWIPSFGVLDWPLVRGIAGAVTRAYVGSDGAMRIIMRKAYGREPTKEEEAGHDAPYRRPGSAEAFMAWNAAPKELTGPDPGAIPCPVLVVFGDRDRIADPAQGPKIVAALPGSRLVIVPGGGHLVLESQHEEVSAAILAWLDEIAPQEKKN